MANTQPHTPQIDSETANEVLYEFDRHHLSIEDLIASSEHLEDEETLHLILLEIHSVRENAAMVQLTEIMSFTNSIENIIFSIMNANIPTSAELTEVILMSIDRLRDLHHVYLHGENFGNLNIENIELALAELSIEYEPDTVEEALKKALWELTNQFTGDPEVDQAPASQADPLAGYTDAYKEDLAVFRSMAIQIDNQCIFWRNRSDALCHWAQAINTVAGSPIDAAQLAAAVYLHDTGMAFISSTILNKSGKLDSYEYSQLQQHPDWGFEVVIRMPAWSEAAIMIKQHHEREDGKGYPGKLVSHEICEGAKLISILDAFFAMIKPRADRPRRRSILRAISEINACAGTQFSENWVDCFNIAIKEDMKSGLLLQTAAEQDD